MDYDKDKADKMTLVLMYLTTFTERIAGNEYPRTWKGYDWEYFKPAS